MADWTQIAIDYLEWAFNTAVHTVAGTPQTIINIIGFVYKIADALWDFLSSSFFGGILDFIIALIPRVDILFAICEIFILFNCLPYMANPVIFLQEFADKNIGLLKFVAGIAHKIIKLVLDLIPG